MSEESASEFAKEAAGRAAALAPPLPAQSPSSPPSKSKSAANKSVHVDGGLYVAIGALTALLVSLSSDGAAKHMPADLLWWLQTIVECVNGGLLALKMFRSTAFANSQGTP